jgi:hypothetical protein
VPKKQSDAVSVESVRAVLTGLRCPNVRRAEGTDEWRLSHGAYRPTPDLVAGPLVGGGDPSDFYIDVWEPTGDQYVKPCAGNPKAAFILHRAVAEKGAFDLADMDDTGEQLVKPMNDKLQRYIASRKATSMLGLAMYFKMTGNQKVGPVIAGLQALSVLDLAFGITQHLGQDAMEKVMAEVVPGTSLPGPTGVVLSLPMKQPLSFVLYAARKTDRFRAVLLVNHAVTSVAHPFAGHPVIRWLRETATP